MLHGTIISIKEKTFRFKGKLKMEETAAGLEITLNILHPKREFTGTKASEMFTEYVKLHCGSVKVEQ